jgi:hypothetical protein
MTINCPIRAEAGSATVGLDRRSFAEKVTKNDNRIIITALEVTE